MEVTPAWRKGTVKSPIQSPRYKGHVVNGIKEMGGYVAYYEARKGAKTIDRTWGGESLKGTHRETG